MAALSRGRGVTRLPPHPWDDGAHRAAIHQAFDRWFVAHAQRATAQAGQLRRALERLCREAEARQRTVALNRALASMREVEPGEFAQVEGV